MNILFPGSDFGLGSWPATQWWSGLPPPSPSSLLLLLPVQPSRFRFAENVLSRKPRLEQIIEKVISRSQNLTRLVSPPVLAPPPHSRYFYIEVFPIWNFFSRIRFYFTFRLPPPFLRYCNQSPSFPFWNDDDHESSHLMTNAQPTCSLDGRTLFFSPCHAGCKNSSQVLF